MKYFRQKWRQYRYRFVPWIAMNLKRRSLRSVPDTSSDKLISDVRVENFLRHCFSIFHENGSCTENTTLQSSQQLSSSATQTTQEHSKQTNINSLYHKVTANQNPQVLAEQNLQHLYDSVGFAIDRRPSVVTGGGSGVVVTKGLVKQGSVVALYPGTIYRPYEPILLQSIGNPFIFRCLDGLLLDGNDRGISRFLFRSCAGRERMGPYETCDISWLTDHPRNPLAVGQYVNNQNTKHPANVAYQEFDIPRDFPFHLRCYIPNVFYAASMNDSDSLRLTRTVVLVALRDIAVGEELFSNYFTLVH